MQVSLAPIKHRDAYTTAVEKRIVEYFTEVIFSPLIEIVWRAGIEPQKLNAKMSALIRALKSGKVWVHNGTFTGKFSASVASELRNLGATFDKTERAFHLSKNQIPDDLKSAMVDSIAKSKDVHWNVERTLDAMQVNVAQAALGLELKPVVDRIVKDLTNQFEDSVDAVETIAVQADVTPGIAAALDRELTTNLDLYVKKFALEEIPKLRKAVADNAFAGGRADKLAKVIENSFGVSKRKAAFLAEQETSLLVSKYREQRYKEIGSVRYTWSTSHDERVRKDHRLLNGKVFFYDSKPVTNLKTGARNNPGEDFRCRCVAIPIVEVTSAN